MRDLIFRGKAKSDGRWIISDSIIQHLFTDGKVYLYDEVKDIDLEVNPDTVGQFTGLTDKNGVNIFEGDVVKIRIGLYQTIGTVFYSEEAASVGIIEYGAEKNFSFMQQSLVKQYNIEIIGNIYDNKDLM